MLRLPTLSQPPGTSNLVLVFGYEVSGYPGTREGAGYNCTAATSRNFIINKSIIITSTAGSTDCNTIIIKNNLTICFAYATSGACTKPTSKTIGIAVGLFTTHVSTVSNNYY